MPVVRVTRQEERLGGAANVALNIKSLGAQATLITVVGEDEAAHRLQQLLQEQGIEVCWAGTPSCTPASSCASSDGRSSCCAWISKIRRTMRCLSQTLADFERVLTGYAAVLFSDYGKGGLTHIARMIGSARAAGKIALVDPKGSDYSRYAGASVLTPNLAELAEVIGGWSSEAQLLERAQTLRERLNVGDLVLTRSEQGISLFDAAGHMHVPAQAREVFDVTGAGDTVIATLATLLAAGMSAREALPLANRAGGIVVGKFGTASVSYEELFA